jgi:hypothetical protein
MARAAASASFNVDSALAALAGLTSTANASRSGHPPTRRPELARARFIKRALNQIFRGSFLQLLGQCQSNHPMRTKRLRTPPRRQANPDTITVLLVGLDPTGCVPPLPSLDKASAVETDRGASMESLR